MRIRTKTLPSFSFFESHPTTRRLDNQGVAVIGLFKIAIPILHAVDFVRMVLSRFIPPVQVHRNVLGLLARKKHERPIVVIRMSSKFC